MQKTTHYQLNQWDGEDRILRMDFNADNAAVDAALHSNASAIAAETAARETAVQSEAQTRASTDAAIRRELNSAVAGAKSEAASKISAEAQARASADAQLQAADLIVKLGEFTLGGDATQLDVSVPGLEQYAEVWIRPQLIAAGGGRREVHLLCDGLDGDVYFCNGYSQDNLAYFTTEDQGGGFLRCSYTQQSFLMDNPLQRTAYQVPLCTLIDKSRLPGSVVHTLNFRVHGSGQFAAGSKVTIYGIKM